MSNQAPFSDVLPTIAPERTPAPTASRSLYARYFFVGMSGVFLLLAALGFGPSYQAVHAGKATLHWFAHVHGAIMGGWLMLFLVQSWLAAKGLLRFHRQLGISAAVFGVLVWITMGVALVRALLVFPPPVEDLNWDTVTLGVAIIFQFGLLFSAGIALRKNGALHKRLLLLATIVLLQAAIDRMPWLPGLTGAYWVRFAYLDALLIPLFVYDRLTLGRIHRGSLAGGAFFVAVQTMVAMNVGSPAVHQFWFNRLAPYVDPVVEVQLTDAQIAPLLGDYGYPNWHVTIYRENGKLFFRMPDQPPMEIAAKSATEFFMRRAAWNLSFVKSADGKVSKLINRQPNQTWELPRM